MSVQMPLSTNLPVEFQDRSISKFSSHMVYTITAGFLALLIWASFALIEETSKAEGQIVPAASISNVHHLEGGIVQRVLISEGASVMSGQVLVQLRPEQASSDLSQLETRIAHLRMKWIRLNSLLTGDKPVFGRLGQRFPSLRNEQQDTFDKELAQSEETLKQLKLTVERLGGQRDSALREADSLLLQVKLAAEQTAIREQSYAKGYTSRHTMLMANSAHEESKQRLVIMEGKISELTTMLDEAQTELQETIAKREQSLADDRAETASQLAEAEETFKKYHDRFDRLQVTSPIDGIVQTLAAKLPGEVIKPGELVAQIVPVEGPVLAEVKLAPRDIGHVRVGSPAEITLSNYDASVIGVIPGAVEAISATTFENEQGLPFYRVRIRLHRQSIPLQDRNLGLSPGTTLQAQISTGSKSLLRYMLKPIYKSFETAFSER